MQPKPIWEWQESSAGETSVNTQNRWLGAETWCGTKAESHGRFTTESWQDTGMQTALGTGQERLAQRPERGPSEGRAFHFLEKLNDVFSHIQCDGRDGGMAQYPHTAHSPPAGCHGFLSTLCLLRLVWFGSLGAHRNAEEGSHSKPDRFLPKICVRGCQAPGTAPKELTGVTERNWPKS